MLILAPTYYLSNFEFLLNFIVKQYSFLLLPNEIKIIDNFLELSTPARCLYVRMYNRKGLIFNSLDFKKYAEIEFPDLAIKELIENNFANKITKEITNNSENLEKFSNYLKDLLAIFTKNELLNYVKIFNPSYHKTIKNYKVNEVYQFIINNISYDDFIELLNNQVIIVQNYEKEMSFFRFLFFGNAYQDMTEFVMRDMGINNFETFAATKFTPLFQTRIEAEEKLRIIEAQQNLYALLENETDLETNLINIATIFTVWFQENKQIHETSKNSYQRFALRLGELFEKNKFLETALQFYQYSNIPPSHERQARIWQTLGKTENALQICELMLENPENATEITFASDFKEKILRKPKTKVLKTVTKYLQDAETIYVAKSYKKNVELGVIDYFKAQNYEGIFVENYIWRAIFALVFWDIIFDFNIHHPLQKRPSDFYSKDFFEKRKPLFIRQLESYATKNILQNEIEKNYHEKYNLTNPFVQWHESILFLSTLLVELLPLESLKLVFLEMAKDMNKGLTGFPDILVWNEKTYSFIEVKSPTDSLSSQQLFWLSFFEKQQIQAKVLRVAWED